MEDWTHKKPTNNFCPECGHGLGSDPSYCQWCLWEREPAKMDNERDK